MQGSFWWWQCSDRCIILPLPPTSTTPFPNKPYGFCGRKAPRKEKSSLAWCAQQAWQIVAAYGVYWRYHDNVLGKPVVRKRGQTVIYNILISKEAVGNSWDILKRRFGSQISLESDSYLANNANNYLQQNWVWLESVKGDSSVHDRWFCRHQFSSRWYLCVRKSPYALHPVSQKFA